MPLIGRFEHLRDRPRSEEAGPLLEKIASQVKPIMSKRGWKVGTLAEFLPANPALLGNNMNAGQRINLRLRPPGNTSTFYEYDQLVLVMLHELAHIEHGPHDANFYRLLGELEEEYWGLKRKGYSGEGFHGAGNRLSSLRVPEHIGKAKGLAAAEKRLATQMKIGKGGVLGGLGIAGRTMREVLAEAAERRIRDDKACNTADSGHAKEIEEEVRKAAEDSVGVDAADLPDAGGSIPKTTTVENPSNRETASGSSISKVPLRPTAGTPRVQPYPASNGSTRLETSLSPTVKPRPSNNPRDPRASAPTQPITPPSRNTHSSTVVNDNMVQLPTGEWSCPTCTLLNPAHSLQCEACGSAKSTTKGDGEMWWCEFCGSGPREMGFWSCTDCGWVRKWG